MCFIKKVSLVSFQYSNLAQRYEILEIEMCFLQCMHLNSQLTESFERLIEA